MKNKDIFFAYVKAYNAKDVDRMLALFDEECVFENVSAGKVTARTKDKAELEALARRSAQAFASREQKVLSLTEGEQRIVAEIEYHAILQTELAGNLKTGDHLELRGISIFEISSVPQGVQV